MTALTRPQSGRSEPHAILNRSRKSKISLLQSDKLLGLTLYDGTGTFNPAIHFDLNEYNVRWCITPEYPNGTWAYFTNIEADGTPIFPYNIGRYYFEDPTGNSPSTIPPNATTVYEGGPEKGLEIYDLDDANPNGDITLIWNSVEGGNYDIERSGTLRNDWQQLAQANGADTTTTTIDTSRVQTDAKHFYRAKLNYIAPFDDSGFVYDNTIVQTPPQNNILLLILDDWGIDASDLYNTRSGTGIDFANMPNLKSLLFTNPATATATSTPDKGLLFTNGHSQPICSPTRATILTGRHPYQHRVGNPETDNTLSASESTFPEIMSTEAPDYNLASFGKWHLGSGNTGARDTGGWPNFMGTISGGVANYAVFNQVKIENGVLTDNGTSITTLVDNGDYASPYATSVQVDNAVNFITAQGTNPWCIWIGFNAPHDPFQDPSPYVIPTAGYSVGNSTNKENYIRMLEALDHEIGRLLSSVDLSVTNIIVIGDNGTPVAVDQAPSGGIASAKGSLTEGGIHVPFFASGPDVIQLGKSDKLIHVVDLFSTILELASVNVSAATSGVDLHSKSIVPILKGTDMEDRCIIAEKFGINATTDGRALIDEDWPHYKLISIQDVTDPNDTPVYEMYEIGVEGVETNTLTTPPAPGDPHETAYHLLVAKDQSLQPVISNVVTLEITLPSTGINTGTGASITLPALTNASNGNIVHPQFVTVGGLGMTWDTGTITVNSVSTAASRVDESGTPDTASLIAQFDLATAGFISGQSYDIVVRFPAGGGNQREFTVVNGYTAP